MTITQDLFIAIEKRVNCRESKRLIGPGKRTNFERTDTTAGLEDNHIDWHTFDLGIKVANDSFACSFNGNSVKRKEDSWASAPALADDCEPTDLVEKAGGIVTAMFEEPFEKLRFFMR
jgi:hypothetical protein